MLKKKSESDIINKWSEALGTMGLTGSKLEGISQLLENQANHLVEETKSEGFPSLLFPVAMKVAAKTISNQILGFASKEEIDEVKKRIQSENRDGKIESVIEGSEFTEKKLEDDKEYQELMKKGVTPLQAPSGVLHYLDYQYAQKTRKRTRRAGKGHKK